MKMKMKKEAKILGKPSAAAMKKLGVKPFDLAEYLDNPETVAAYVSQVLADGDVEEVKRAIGYVAKARGMTQVAKDAGIGRVALYKALSPGTQMRADTMLNVMRAVGMELRAVAA